MQNEQEIIKKCLDGDRNSQRALYEHYSNRMLGVCYRYAGCLADAEDIMQEAFIKAFTHIYQYRFEGNFEGWLRRVMVNTAINYLRTNKKFREAIDIDTAENAVYEPLESDAHLNAKDIIETIQALPDGYRAVLNLYSIEGYSHREIGEMLGIAESTSRSQYARARVLLARILSAKGRISSIGLEPIYVK
jgi:RNA polymerase sigma-70 factor (ECF subfamily)